MAAVYVPLNMSHVSFSDAMPCPCPPARARSLRRRSLLVAADGRLEISSEAGKLFGKALRCSLLWTMWIGQVALMPSQLIHSKSMQVVQ